MANILKIEDLKVYFQNKRGLLRSHRSEVKAVDGVDLSVGASEIVGLVGESGCGKTTLSRAVVNLVKPTAGKIYFKGEPVDKLIGKSTIGYYKNVQFVFQDPFDSLNPRKSVYQILSSPLINYKIVPRSEIKKEVINLLNMAGLYPGEQYLDRYPHQFSGGQRQRICIARALAPRPVLIMADEAVSSLDVSIRSQILSLLLELKQKLALSYLFVTHDLGVVRSFCDRVYVMYLGKIIEEGTTEEIFLLPRHPYTRALLASSPVLDPEIARNKTRIILSGDVPSPSEIPEGCRFHPRCPIARTECKTLVPEAVQFSSTHRSACLFAKNADQWKEVPALNIRDS